MKEELDSFEKTKEVNTVAELLRNFRKNEEILHLLKPSEL